MLSPNRLTLGYWLARSSGWRSIGSIRTRWSPRINEKFRITTRAGETCWLSHRTLPTWDIAESYRLGVNRYIVKPVDFEEFTDVTRGSL